MRPTRPDTAYRTAIIFSLLLYVTGCTTPSPLDRDELAQKADSQKKHLDSRAEELADQITFSQALGFAIEHNIEFRLQAYQAAMATGNRQMANMSLLPSVTARAGYRQRSNVLASVSESVDTGQVSLAASTSSDRVGHSRDLELGWNVLDFSLAWFRAREFGEQALIAEEERRRVSQQLALDLLTAWDRALLFQSLSKDLETVRTALEAGLSFSEQVDQNRLRDQAEIIEFRKGLLLMLRRVQQLVRQMEDARSELARLMGVAPHHLPDLQPDETTALLFINSQSVSIEALHTIALSERPEMRQALYLHRSAKNDSRRRLVESLPNIIFSFGSRYDSNSYLVNNHWRDSSMNLSLNLVRLASIGGQRRLGKLNEKAAAARVEIQAMAILSQVSIAERAWRGAAKDACLVRTLSRLDDRRLNLMEARAKAALVDQLTITRLQMDNILFQIEAGLAVADMRRAALMLAMSIGVGIVPDEISSPQAPDGVQQLSEWLQVGMYRYVNSLILDGDAPIPDYHPHVRLADWENSCELL
jgi:outer membrane protein, multidrug efflux system